MNKIPLDMQTLEYDYVRIKENTKKPIDNDWNTPGKGNFKYNAPEITNHKHGIGIIVGKGIIDFELEGSNKGEKGNPFFEECNNLAKKELPRTKTFKTPSGGIRRLYKNKELTTNIKGIATRNNIDYEVLETRGNGQSIFFGKGYELIDDSPIAEISLIEIKKTFYDYLEHEREKTIIKSSNHIDIPITNVISTSQFKKRNKPGEYQGTHPKHGSTNKIGWNFAFNTNKNTWYCHSAGHECGGDTLSLIAVMEDIIKCEEVKHGLKGDNFIKTLQIAEEKYGYKPEIIKESQGELNKKAIAIKKEWDFENVLPKDHLISLYLDKVCSVSDTYPEYVFNAGLNCLATLTDRKVIININPHPHFTNLWIVNLGLSTISRKSTAQKHNEDVYNYAGLNYKLLPDDSSPEQLVADLSALGQKNFMPDEFGHFLATARKKYQSGIEPLMCRLYDSPDTYTKALRKDTFTIKNAFINLFSSTVPGQIKTYSTETDLNSGFYPRILFCYPERNKPRKRIDNLDINHQEKMDNIIKRIIALNKFFSALRKNGLKLEAEFTKEAFDYYDNWCIQWENYLQDSPIGEELSAFYGRTSINVLKIATLLDLGEQKWEESILKCVGKNDFSQNSQNSSLTEKDCVKIVKNVNNGKIEKKGNSKIPLLKIKISLETLKKAVLYANNLYLPGAEKVIWLVKSGANDEQIERIFEMAKRFSTKNSIEHSKLLHKSHLKSREFSEIVSTLEESGRFFIQKDQKTGKKYYTPLEKVDVEAKMPEVSL